MTRSQLNQAQCGNPDCSHTSCTELFLHSRCHTGGGIVCVYSPTEHTVALLCAQCLEMAAYIQVEPLNLEDTGLEDKVLLPPCHKDSALNVCYSKVSGHLTFNCCECEAVVAEIAVS